MLRNYITIALRNIMRSKAYSFINISGLSLGVACCLLLALYIQDEMSYDKHHNRVDDVYRIVSHFEGGNFNFPDQGAASPPIAMALVRDIPEVEAATRIINPPGVVQNLIKYEDNIFYETDGHMADSTLFDVLTFKFINGNPDNALDEPNSVVITDKLAAKLFGTEPALDKIISIGRGGEAANFKITGVIEDEKKSHIHVTFITSMSSTDGWSAYLNSDRANDEWAGQNFVPSYLKLVPGANTAVVTKKINEVLQKYGAEDLKAMGMQKVLSIELVKDIYLKSAVGQSPRIIYTYVIASIAVFILLIACINFMNLSTARATKRANEIGVRKVMGAFRSSLITQILGEAMIIVLFSIVLSVVIMQLALPYFNDLTGKTISFGTENLVYFISALATITIVTGLIAGSYPAFYLSSFQPAQVLKGKFNMSNSSGWLRRSLVVFQFMIAITLVCGMIVISNQLNYMQEQDLGFDANAKIVLPLRSAAAKEAYQSLRTEFQKNSAVKMASGANYLPGANIFHDMSFYKEGENMDKAINIRRNAVDHGFIELMNMKLLAGRTFTDNREQDGGTKLILNRTAAAAFNFTPEEAVGQHLAFDYEGKKYDFDVIGVMEDFHQVSLKEEIKPTLLEMYSKDEKPDFLVLSVTAQNFNQTVSYVEETWKKVVDGTPFEYSFLDQNIQKQYEDDKKVSSIINSFSFIAMLISCLGLYGLSTYMAERRFKEIGVRKVMGASINQIVGLMSKEFIKLVLVAFIISVPLSWYFMDKWLQGFAYHTSVEITVFIYAGTGALLIALLTVSFESIRAASVNPVKSLRNE
ncbi:MAG TPA: ABC transporter permease [Cyclobacteriaceae bacterium]